MMSRPTEAELAILGVLWDRGPSTVREVFEILEPLRGTGYTTVLKLMQIMADKGLVDRDDSVRSHIYEAAVSRRRVQAQLLRDLTDRAFGGSTASLVMSALSSRPADAEELAQIRVMLERLMSRDGPNGPNDEKGKKGRGRR